MLLVLFESLGLALRLALLVSFDNERTTVATIDVIHYSRYASSCSNLTRKCFSNQIKVLDRKGAMSARECMPRHLVITAKLTGCEFCDEIYVMLVICWMWGCAREQEVWSVLLPLRLRSSIWKHW